MRQGLDHTEHGARKSIGRYKPVLLLQEFSQVKWSGESLQALFEKVERAKQEWEATADALPELIALVDDHGRVLRTNRTIEAWQLGQVTAVHGLAFHRLIHPSCTDLFCRLNLFLQQAIRKSKLGQSAEMEAYDPILGRHLLLRVRPVPMRKRLASSVAVVVVHDITEQKRTEETVQCYTERLEAMSEIQKAILAAHSPEEIAQAALSRIRRLVPFHQAYVTLFRPQTDEFLVLAIDALGKTHLRPGQSFPADAFRGSVERWPAQFVVVEDFAELESPSMMEQQLESEGIRSYVNFPLAVEGEFVGSFCLGDTYPQAFAPEHVPIVCEVASLLAIAIHQAQLVEKLQRANDELQEALQTKNEMIQNVSHELRTPLSIIYGYTRLLGTADLGPLTAAQARAVSVMHGQGDRLCFMVERLLTLQTFQADQMHRVQMDLNTWLPEVLQVWETRLAQMAPNIRLELEMPPTLPSLAADPQFLAQAIDVLVDNAIKFSPHGGLVRVRAESKSDHIIIVVSDTGIGIPRDKLHQVFKCFYQVDGSTTRRYGGMGIGLTLCRTIVEAHGGRIWAESSGEGRGSTFYLTLPIGGGGEGCAREPEHHEGSISVQEHS